jgi:hypothetical protein
MASQAALIASLSSSARLVHGPSWRAARQRRPAAITRPGIRATRTVWAAKKIVACRDENGAQQAAGPLWRPRACDGLKEVSRGVEVIELRHHSLPAVEGLTGVGTRGQAEPVVLQSCPGLGAPVGGSEW